jgi:RNA polymerase sigma factor (sigma-70 family)
MSVRISSPSREPRSADTPDAPWSDDRLVCACADGDEAAWAALIQKYKRLIHSVPARAGASPQDAADVFQAVCVELFAALPTLRRVESLPAWLLTIASHKTYHLRRQQQQRRIVQSLDDDAARIDEPGSVPTPPLEQAEHEEAIREAIRELSPRCRELIHLLFYENPPRSYKDVADRLGIALGSVGVARSRCLVSLEQALRRRGVL